MSYGAESGEAIFIDGMGNSIRPIGGASKGHCPPHEKGAFVVVKCGGGGTERCGGSENGASIGDSALNAVR